MTPKFVSQGAQSFASSRKTSRSRKVLPQARESSAAKMAELLGQQPSSRKFPRHALKETNQRNGTWHYGMEYPRRRFGEFWRRIWIGTSGRSKLRMTLLRHRLLKGWSGVIVFWTTWACTNLEWFLQWMRPTSTWTISIGSGIFTIKGRKLWCLQNGGKNPGSRGSNKSWWPLESVGKDVHGHISFRKNPRWIQRILLKIFWLQWLKWTYRDCTDTGPRTSGFTWTARRRTLLPRPSSGSLIIK